MILDRLASADLCASRHPRFAAACGLFRDTDLAPLADGHAPLAVAGPVRKAVIEVLIDG